MSCLRERKIKPRIDVLGDVPMDEQVSRLGSRDNGLRNPRIRTTNPQHLSTAKRITYDKERRVRKPSVQILRNILRTNLGLLRFLGRLREKVWIGFSYCSSPLFIGLQQVCQDWIVQGHLGFIAVGAKGEGDVMIRWMMLIADAHQRRSDGIYLPYACLIYT